MRVAFNGAQISTIALGMEFEHGAPLGPQLALTSLHSRQVDAWQVRKFGKSSRVRERFHELVMQLRENAPPGRRMDVVVRVYDDGVAFRYRVPQQPALHEARITQELTAFTFASDATAYALPLPYASSYEARYRVTKLSVLPVDSQYGVPLLLRLTSGTLIGLTEAELVDYAGLYLQPATNQPGLLVSRLAPGEANGPVTVTRLTPFQSPWRVLMIGKSPAPLMESSLVWLLNEPSAFADASWIHPGMVQFPWWNGYYFPEDTAQSRHVLNTATLKRYIDFCAKYGIADHSIDGYNFDYAWYGGPIEYAGADVTVPSALIDMPEVLAYAHSHGVRTRLWVHAAGLRRQLDHALDVYQRWGVEGIMVDFVDRDDQSTVVWVNEVTRKAAAHHLTVNFHGIYKPTGLERTWPNLLSHEGVYGQEYNKWDPVGSTPDHEILLPFVRGLAGFFDVHQGSFSPIAPSEFRPQFLHPYSIGTLTRQLAMYVVYDNPLAMLADAPSAYESQPQAFEILRQLPTTWDETRVLSARLGESIVTARRKGRDWYLGAMNAGAPAGTTVMLSFLKSGRYRAEILADDFRSPYSPSGFLLDHRILDATDRIVITLAPAGGFVAHLSPLSSPEH